METNIPKQINKEFNQKKVNLVFHYTKKLEFLLNILKDGFQPSYCYEKINDLEYYIPMVSFCNIPLTDVDDYMRYGKYGIGLSLDWAIRNGISPVVYIHENTPFANLHKQINVEHLTRLMGAMLQDGFDRISDPARPPKAGNGLLWMKSQPCIIKN